MKPENIETAKTLCRDLDHVDMKLDTLVDERNRAMEKKGTSGTIKLFDKEPFTVDINTYQSILTELIADYSNQKFKLIKQIELL